MTAKFNVNGYDMQFSDTDVVNPLDFVPAGETNYRNSRPWLLHDQGFTLAVVFASCEQDAVDEAVDAGKLNRFMIAEGDMADYGDEGEGIAYLGNAGEPFDIESLGIIELPNPAYSFAAMFMATRKAEEEAERVSLVSLLTREVTEEARDLFSCNCAGTCETTCTHAKATRLLSMLPK